MRGGPETPSLARGRKDAAPQQFPRLGLLLRRHLREILARKCFLRRIAGAHRSRFGPRRGDKLRAAPHGAKQAQSPRRRLRLPRRTQALRLQSAQPRGRGTIAEKHRKRAVEQRVLGRTRGQHAAQRASELGAAAHISALDGLKRQRAPARPQRHARRPQRPHKIHDAPG